MAGLVSVEIILNLYVKYKEVVPSLNINFLPKMNLLCPVTFLTWFHNEPAQLLPQFSFLNHYKNIKIFQF